MHTLVYLVLEWWKRCGFCAPTRFDSVSTIRCMIIASSVFRWLSRLFYVCMHIAYCIRKRIHNPMQMTKPMLSRPKTHTFFFLPAGLLPFPLKNISTFPATNCRMRLWPNYTYSRKICWACLFPAYSQAVKTIKINAKRSVFPTFSAHRSPWMEHFSG